jgi:hypothetical protein
MDSEEKETKKQLVLKNKRALLKIIKEKPRKWNEIVKEAEEKYKISKDSVNKYLDEFKEIGIIKKDNDGRWWYVEHEVAIEDKDYKIAMNHSRLILPGFVSISIEYGGVLPLENIKCIELNKLGSGAARIFSYEYSPPHFSDKITRDYAEEHLKTGYPEAWTIVSKALTSVKELKNLEEKAKTRITENLEKKIKEKNIPIPKTFGFPYLENYVDAIADYIWVNAINERKIDWNFTCDNEKENVYLERVLFSKKGYEELIKEEICKVLPEVEEKVKEYKEVEENLSKEREEADKKLLEIIYKVFSGEPLKGKCKGCPRVCLYYQPSKEQNEENNQQKSQVSR